MRAPSPMWRGVCEGDYLHSSNPPPSRSPMGRDPLRSPKQHRNAHSARAVGKSDDAQRASPRIAMSTPSSQRSAAAYLDDFCATRSSTATSPSSRSLCIAYRRTPALLRPDCGRSKAFAAAISTPRGTRSTRSFALASAHAARRNRCSRGLAAADLGGERYTPKNGSTRAALRRRSCGRLHLPTSP